MQIKVRSSIRPTRRCGSRYRAFSTWYVLTTYLQLERQGIDGIPEGTSMADPALLMEVMELQEALAEAEDEVTVQQVQEANQAHMQHVLAELDQAFTDTPLDTQRVQALAMQLRYWTNIDKAIREWQPGQRPDMQH